GLAPLKVDLELSKVAREKSRDMSVNKYFDHNSPTYGSPFDMMKKFGITYRSAGENIAYGQRTPEEVVKAWMNSSGHRANILNSSFTHIGVGYVAEGNYWTQQFIGK
ncbi:MAG TPA: CAP domain-containing protein, partial [Bacillaceae bacterium]